MTVQRFDIHVGRFRFRALGSGPASAPLVLCLHGFPDHAPSFQPLFGALVSAGYRVVAPWMRGYRPSDLSGPFGFERLARDVIELADALSPHAPVRVVGHDWGGVATYGALALAPGRFIKAVVMAVPHPLAFVRSVLVSPRQAAMSWYMGMFQLPGLPERWLRRGGGQLIESLWRRWSPNLDLSAVDMPALQRCVLQSMPAPLEYYRAMLRPVGPALGRLLDPSRPERARIEVPTLHLHGADDGCISPRAARGQAAWFRAEFRSEVWPGLGHFLHLEAPERVGDRIVRWFGDAVVR